MNLMRLILAAIILAGGYVFCGSGQASAQYWCPTTLMAAHQGCMMRCQARFGIDSVNSQRCWAGCSHYVELFQAAGCVGKRVAKDSFSPGVTEQCSATLSSLKSPCENKCGKIPTGRDFSLDAVAYVASCREGCPFMIEELGICEGKGLVRVQ